MVSSGGCGLSRIESSKKGWSRLGASVDSLSTSGQHRSMRGLVLGALMLASGCGGASAGGESASWTGAPWSEQYPDELTGEPCLTVWVVSGRGCGVGDESGSTGQCVAGSDPWIWTEDGVPGTCVVDAVSCGVADCSVVTGE